MGELDCSPSNPLSSHFQPAEKGVFFSPFPNRQILNCFKLKEFADSYFKLDENGGYFSKRIGNTVGEGEIARFEQFLLYRQCFQKIFIEDK